MSKKTEKRIQGQVRLFAFVAISVISLALAPSLFGQEITGPDEVGMNQPAWLKLEVPEGSTGKFDGHLLDIDPEHVAPGAALFFSTESGEFRVVAAIVDAEQNIEFVEHVIIVVGGGEHPKPLAITVANVKMWLQEIPLDIRNQLVTNAIIEEELTRQEAVSQTFINIGNAGAAIASIPGLDQLLSTALVSVFAGSAEADWKPFADSIDEALTALKDKDPTAKEYAAAFLVIGEALK